MPQTKKGEKIENAMEKEYGTEKGKRVYYALIFGKDGYLTYK